MTSYKKTDSFDNCKCIDILVGDKVLFTVSHISEMATPKHSVVVISTVSGYIYGSKLYLSS